MAYTRQIINVGTTADDGSGDYLRDALVKVNSNFENLWDRSPVNSNVDITGNTISTTVSNLNLILDPNGSGILTVQSDATINGVLTANNLKATGNRIHIDTIYTPTSAVGASGDSKGDIAYDTNYIYLCTANYDGTSSIWKRVAVSTWS